MLIDWGADGTLPCEIWAFIDLEELPHDASIDYGGINVQTGVYAVVESSNYVEDETEIGMSDIFIPIAKEVESINSEGYVTKRRFYLADVEAFLEPVNVVPDIGSMPRCKYFQVKSRGKWADEFVEWIEMPHHHDEIDDEEA